MISNGFCRVVLSGSHYGVGSNPSGGRTWSVRLLPEEVPTAKDSLRGHREFSFQNNRGSDTLDVSLRVRCTRQRNGGPVDDGSSLEALPWQIRDEWEKLVAGYRKLEGSWPRLDELRAISKSNENPVTISSEEIVGEEVIKVFGCVGTRAFAAYYHDLVVVAVRTILLPPRKGEEEMVANDVLPGTRS